MVEGIAATEIAKLVIDLGVTATLLILFVMHFLRKDKDSDKKVTAAYEDCRRQIEATYRDAQEKIEAANRTIREREDMLIAQNAQRAQAGSATQGGTTPEGVREAGKHPDAEHGPDL